MKLLGFPDSPQAFSVFLTDLTENLYTDRQAVVFVFDDLFLVDDIQVRTFLSNLIAARLETAVCFCLHVPGRLPASRRLCRCSW